MTHLATVALFAGILAPGSLLAFCRPDGVLVAADDDWGLVAPDGSAVVWSTTRGLAIAETVRSSPSPAPSGSGGGVGSVSRHCPVDWSADSRYLLVRDVPLMVPLDSYDRIAYWTMERAQRSRRPVDPQPLRFAVEQHWLAKRRDVALGGGYYLEALGWESATTHRIVFRAWRRLQRLPQTAVARPGPVDMSQAGSGAGTAPAGGRTSPSEVGADVSERLLGYWSVEPTGLDPRLLAETPDGFVVPRFGKVVGIVSGDPPATR